MTATTGRVQREGAAAGPGFCVHADQLAQLLNALDQHRPGDWMICDDPDSDDGWVEDFNYIRRDDIENVLAQTALPFAMAQLEWLKRTGRRLN